MGKIRRAGYLFISWIGDHSPRHVHVFKNGRLILKWNLEASVVMSGHATSRLRKIIAELVQEGRL